MLAILLLALAADFTGPPAPPPAGYYAFVGRAPDGEECRGVALLVPTAGGYRLSWLYDDGKTAAATAVVEGDRLLVGWGNGVGVWVVKRSEDGTVTLHGTFRLTNYRGVGTETLTFLRPFTKEL